MVIGQLAQTDSELGKLDATRIDEIADAVWENIKNDETVDKAFLQSPVLMRELRVATARTLKTEERRK